MVRIALAVVVAAALVAGASLAVHVANRRSGVSFVRTADNPVDLDEAARPARHSRVVESTIASAVLGRNVPVRLYIPAHVRTDRKYPWLLLLHGNPGTDNDFFVHGFAHALDVAIAHHELPPLYAIAPDGNAGPNGDSEWLDAPFAAIETFLLDDMIPNLERELPLAAGSEAHAVVGVSMGGFGALNLAYRHPDTFASVVSLSGYTVADGSVYAPDSPQGRANSPQLLARQIGPRVATMLADGGALDLPGFTAENEVLEQTLVDVHADVELHEEDAEHGWPYWTRLFPSVLTFVAHHLKTSQAAP